MQTARNPRGLRFLPKVTFITTVGLISAAIAYQAAAQNVFTKPVGFYTESITNVSGGYNTFALPFQQLANDQGLITSVSSASNLTVACATCATANYALATSLNYVQFETGAGVGHSYAIGSQDSSGDLALVMTGGDNLQTIGVAANDTYSIHPYTRIQDAFGTVATTSLHSSNNSGRADNVLVWNGSTFLVYFPNNNGNWIGGVNGGSDPLLPDESVLVLRRTATPTNIVAIGGVRTTNLITTLSTGYNLVGNSFPSAVVVSNLNLLAAGSGYLGSNNSSRADNLLVWNGSTYDVLFWNTSSSQWVGGQGGSEVIWPGSTYFVLLKNGHSGEWPRPLPYSP